MAQATASSVFEETVVGDDGVSKLVPRQRWRRYEY
jgi:hypothetical protein